MLHLPLGGIERSGVVDYEIGCLDFFFVGNLHGHAASYFGTGGVFGDSHALGVAPNALFGMAGHDGQAIETAGHSGFEDERGFDDGDGIRIALGDFYHPLVLVRDHGGMDNCVEFLDSWRRAAWLAERDFGQPGTVDTSIGIHHFTAESADDFFIDRVTGLHEPVRDGVGLDQVGSELDKHHADGGFAARDAAGEAEF